MTHNAESRSPLRRAGLNKPTHSIAGTPWAAYGLSLLAIAAAVGMRWLLDPLLADLLPFVTIFGAVAFAVWIGGYLPAILVLIIGFIACDFLFIPPRGTFHIAQARDLVVLAAYAFTCGIIIVLGEAMRISQRRFEMLARQHEQAFPPMPASLQQALRKHNLHDLSVIGFVGMLAVLTAGGVLGYLAASRLVADEHWVTRSHEVVGQLQTIRSTLIDVETGQRGYLLTQDPRYLKPYDAAIGRIAGEIAKAQELLADDARQLSRLKEVQELVDTKIQKASSTLAMFRAGDQAGALQQVQINAGKTLMGDVRQAIALMQQEEHKLLARRTAEADTSFQIALASIVLPAGIGVVLIGAVFYLSRRNFTQRQHAAEVLTQQRERLRVTLASIGDAVITTDIDGRITYLNPVAESVTGWLQSDAVGQPLSAVFRIVNEYTRNPVENPAARALREGVIVGLANHTVLIARDATECPIDDSAAPIRDGQGAIVGCVLIFRDITQRRLAEKQLWDSRELLRITLASIGDAVITTDTDGRITYLNAVAESVTGWTQSDAAGQPLPVVFHIINEQTGKPVENPAQRALRQGLIVGLANHTILIARDGSQHPIDDSAAPIRDAQGRVVGCVLIFRDITQRKLMEHERAHRAEQLAAALAKRTQEVTLAEKAMARAERMAAVGTMASGLVHDLRNIALPLSQRLDVLLADPSLDRKIKGELAVISALLDHLRAMSQNLSLFSRDPQHEGTQGATELASWCLSVRGLMEASLAGKDPGTNDWIRFKCNIPTGLMPVKVAPHRLTQAVLNLVHNAKDAIVTVRAQDAARKQPGCITLDARPMPQMSAIALSVIDDGCGMDEQTMRRAVEPFFTTKDRPSAAGVPGSGMGLSLAHAICEACGGKLDIQSRLGEGTTITMVLPIAVEAPHLSPQPKSAPH